MTTTILTRSENLVENKMKIKRIFPMESSVVHLACAGVYANKDAVVDEEKLLKCKTMLNGEVGFFSNFRSTARPIIISMLALNDDPEGLLSRALEVYSLLKEDFLSSIYLPLTAMVIAENAESERYQEIAKRTRGLYIQMKSEHPFLTSGEDSALCALMALMDKTDSEMIQDSEECYRILRKQFRTSHSVQGLSNVLALFDGTPEEKCERTITFFGKLMVAGFRYGVGYELPTLGVLSMTGGDLDNLVTDVVIVHSWLSKQKGFRLFSGIPYKQCLMYAGMIVARDNIQAKLMQTTAVTGTLSLVVAQQTAVCAAAASSAAAAASSSSH